MNETPPPSYQDSEYEITNISEKSMNEIKYFINIKFELFIVIFSVIYTITIFLCLYLR